MKDSKLNHLFDRARHKATPEEERRTSAVLVVDELDRRGTGAPLTTLIGVRTQVKQESVAPVAPPAAPRAPVAAPPKSPPIALAPLAPFTTFAHRMTSGQPVETRLGALALGAFFDFVVSPSYRK